MSLIRSASIISKTCSKSTAACCLRSSTQISSSSSSSSHQQQQQSRMFHYQHTSVLLAKGKAKVPDEAEVQQEGMKTKAAIELQNKIYKDELDEEQFLQKHHANANDNIFLMGLIPELKEALAPEITKKTIQSAMEFFEYHGHREDMRNFVLIDVREYENAMDYTIPTAINIPLEEIAGDALTILNDPDTEESARKALMHQFGLKNEVQIPNEEDNIVIFGETADESEFGCYLLRQAGFDRVFNYRGGVLDWHNMRFIPIKKKKLSEQ